GRRVLRRADAYLRAILPVWGALLIPIVRLASRRPRRLPRAPDPIDGRVRPLLLAAAVVPVAFFGLVSLESTVQANWPAVYVIGAAPLLAAFCATRLRETVVCCAINAALVLALAGYARVPLGAGVGNRVVRELSGYSDLATRLRALEGPLFAGHHQLVAELNFHAPQLGVRQWPGIRRPSEYLRRAAWTPDTAQSLAAAGSFWLVTVDALPLHLPGFAPVDA